jgi:5-methylthioadenosine/S-adenosylhomocysteine deaminase
VTVRLVADAVFTVDAHDTVWSPGAVEVDEGLITWVGDPRATPPGPQTRVQQLGGGDDGDGGGGGCGGLLMPGLVNCHAHSPMTLVRSAGDGLPLDRWLAEAVWPREALHGDEDVFWGMTLGASEMLLNGITTTCEQYLHGSVVADAALASGIRCMLTPGVFDMPGRDTDGAWKAHLAAACRVFDEMDGAQGRLHVGFGPHSAYSLPPAGLTAVAEEAQRRGALTQIHLAETEAEGRVVEERYGMRAPALLASLGVLDGPVLAAHAVWLNEADLDVMSAHEVAVAHCPGSNGKLGSGVARLAAMLARGIRVGLGTDGPASNDDLHLWDEMRLAAILARATAADPAALSSAAALRLATRGGGEALGLPVGAIEVGRPADIIRLRTDDARFVPATNEVELLGHLVWAGAGYLVTDVWVGGAPVVVGGECIQIDSQRARAEVGERARRLFAS